MSDHRNMIRLDKLVVRKTISTEFALYFCREADERIEVGERELGELRAHTVECREEIDHLKNELAQVDKLKCR